MPKKPRKKLSEAAWFREVAANPITPEQIIEAALAPPAATLRITEDTTEDEISAFVRGDPRIWSDK